MLDGSLGGRTALLKEPYADCPKETGTQTHSREKLNKMVRIAHDNGYQVAVHAIGDKAADIVADAYIAALKENPKNDHRHGIVHFQTTQRGAANRAVSVCQPQSGPHLVHRRHAE